MTKTQFAKGAAALIVGYTTSSLVKEIIKNNVSPEKVTDKAAVIIASYVLGAITADITKKWTDAKIDELIDWWMKNVTERNS